MSTNWGNLLNTGLGSNETRLRDNRYICSVLEDMRKLNDTRNYGYLEGLIEEAQSYANRMENGLQTAKECGYAMWRTLEDKKLTDAEKFAKLRTALNKRFEFRSELLDLSFGDDDGSD
jgi:hypothetical protein